MLRNQNKKRMLCIYIKAYKSKLRLCKLKTEWNISVVLQLKTKDK